MTTPRAVVTAAGPGQPFTLSVCNAAGLVAAAELSPRQAMLLASDLLALLVGRPPDAPATNIDTIPAAPDGRGGTT